MLRSFQREKRERELADTYRTVVAGPLVVDEELLKAFAALDREQTKAEILADDLVDAWHEGSGPTLPIYTYMKLSWDEYKAWAADARNLPADFLERHGLA